MNKILWLKKIILIKGQFWAIYGNCSTQGRDAVRFYFEQLDSLKRLFRRYPETFAFATTANGRNYKQF